MIAIDQLICIMLSFRAVRQCWMRRFVCFNLSLLLCLLQGKVCPAIAVDPAMLVQQGVERYQAEDYQGAIAPWHTALARYRAENNATHAAIVLENLARTVQQLGQSSEAAKYWGEIIALYRGLENPQKLNRALTEQAQTYNHLGQPRRALAQLCKAPVWGQSLGQVWGQADIQQPPQCVEGTALQIAQTHHDHLGQIAAVGTLAEAYRLLGKYDAAQAYLAETAALLQTVKDSGIPTSSDIPAHEEATATEFTVAEQYAQFELSLLSSYGNVAIAQAQAQYRKASATASIGDQLIAKQILEQAQQFNQEAVQWIENAVHLATQLNQPLEQLQLFIRLISLYQQLDQPFKAKQAQAQTMMLLAQLPASQSKAFAWLNLARLSNVKTGIQTNIQTAGAEVSRKVGGEQCPVGEQIGEAQSYLEQGLAIAMQIHNHRAASFALGALGHLAECQRHYTQALGLTQQAQLAAENSLQARDSAYLWDWQAGRLLNHLGQGQQAIQSYKQAVKKLEEIRSDMLTSSPEIQFDFRDTVEPIYRELAALDLAQIERAQIQGAQFQGSQIRDLSDLAHPESANLELEQIQTTLETVDALKLAELQNYFGNDCVIEPISQVVTQLEREGTAIVNTLLFGDRLAIIYSFPNGKSQVEWAEISADELRQTTIAFRRQLEWYQRADEYSTALGQQMYDWLIKPFALRLEQESVTTLIFINDGILRSVPMAALHDGQDYLIQHYAIATTPSLQLTEPAPLSNESNSKVLAMGLTEESAGFVALPFVQTEVEAIQARFPKTKTLLNDDFNSIQLSQELAASHYPIVHIATHGQFGIEPQDNFLVAGKSEKITISELDQLIREASPTTEPIELLALTACQTAIGDDRAALGLAGVALRAGAKSAIASLWSINDESTAQVMDEFYRQLAHADLNKAEALRQAQIAQIEQGEAAAHPARWAPYILIGNWL